MAALLALESVSQVVRLAQGDRRPQARGRRGRGARHRRPQRRRQDDALNVIIGRLRPDAGRVSSRPRHHRVPAARALPRRHRADLPDPPSLRRADGVRERPGRRDLRRRHGPSARPTAPARRARADRPRRQGQHARRHADPARAQAAGAGARARHRPRVLLLDEIAGGLTEPEVHGLVAMIHAHPRARAWRSSGSSTSSTRSLRGDRLVGHQTSGGS